ncbi:hypothetical protein EYC59_05075 [Candidatus Saccharibacteria bacterium]|nr:MAG: hypothetical protein EYC59_05075 [Candidatus Saccharibacteria bacterium]
MGKKSPANREKLIHRYIKRLYIAGISFVVLGIASILKVIAERTWDVILPSWVDSVGLIVFIAGQVLVYTSPLILNVLRQQDEYEFLESKKAKANAYNFLNLGVLIALWLSGLPQMAMFGVLAIVLGMSWIITAKGGANLDV